MKSDNLAKNHIIGIGGIFFKSIDPRKLQDWYVKNLGLTSQVPYSENDDAISFAWKTMANENENTVWAPFKDNTDYFNPSSKEWMINYIVRDLKGLLEDLETKGIKTIDKIQHLPYGKFVHIIDPEGNKIELWEPNKEFFKSKY